MIQRNFQFYEPFLDCAVQKRKSMRKLYLLAILLLFAYGSFGQSELSGNTFKTDVFIGDKSGKNKKSDIHLSGLDKSHPWGYFIVFDEDGTFTSYNQVSCGMDCRKRFSGTYTITDNQINFVVENVTYFDICVLETPKQKTYSYGTFAISEKDGKITLVD